MKQFTTNLGIIIILYFVLFLLPQKIFSIECDPQAGITCNSNQECTDLIQKCSQKANDLSQQVNTLSSQIQYMDTQIYLTQIKIQETEQNIKSAQNEIDILGSRITGLDSSLNYLSKLLIERIFEGYKQRNVSLLNLLLDSNSAGNLINKIQYYKATQDNNQKLLVQVEESKQNFEEQKQLREQKVQELDSLKITLDNQQVTLNSQKAAKQKLLVDTQNSESVYRNMVTRAQAQLAAFKSFVQSSGADSVISANSFGSGPDGNYFSQRDARWANQTIGYSSDNILSVGCLVTSVAMALKKNGVDTNPSVIASTPGYFDGNTANMKYRWDISWPNGLKGYQISSSQVDDELNNGHYVIVGINYGVCKANSDHFVILTAKDGSDYKMYDPLYGPNEHFYSHYSQMCDTEVIK